MTISTPNRVALASAIGNAVGMQAALRVIFALFLQPVSDGLGITRAEYLASAAVGPIATALAVLFYGRLIDRIGPRRVLIWGLLAFALAEMALSLMTPSPLIMAALWFLFGLAAASQAPTGYVKIISGWFTERRGLALGLTLGVGAGIGGALTTVVIGGVMDQWGWRAAFLALGGIALVVGVPALLWGLRDPVRDDRDGPEAVTATQGGMTGKEARRTPTFWLILVAILLHQMVLSGMAAQQGAVLADLGLRPQAIGLFVAVFGLSFAGGQAILGWVMDRYDTPKVGVPFFAAGLLGILAFHYLIIGGVTTSAPALFITALLFGMGSGAELSLQGYYITRFFGLKAAGELFGTLMMVFVVSGAIGGILFGVSYDRTGSYDFALKIGEVLLVIGIILIAMLRPYTFTVHGARSDKATV